MPTSRPSILALSLVVTCGAAGFTQDAVDDKARDKPKSELKAEKGTPASISFSSDRKRVATGGSYQDKSYLWDVKAGKPIAELVDAGDLVEGVEFSRDGRYIVTEGLIASTAKTRVRLWNGQTGKLLNDIPVDLGTSATFSPDSKILVTSNARRMGLQFYRLPDCEQIGELRHELPGSPEPLIVSPDGQTIAGAVDKGVWLGDSRTAATRAKFEAASNVKKMAFSPDGRFLATGGEDGNVQCWDLAEGGLVWGRKLYTERVVGLSFAPNGSALATAGREGVVRLLRPTTGDEIQVIKRHKTTLEAIDFAPDGKTLAVGQAFGFGLFEVKTPEPEKGVAKPKSTSKKKARKK